MANEEIKNKIQKLVDKYESLKRAGKIKSYNEAQTRNEFIEPLFEFLGWDMRNSERESEVTTEENVSGDRVDLAFRITGIPKFYLEAKSLKTDLDIEKYALQAINYSWNKGVSWAVLTDFESIKVFNAQTNSTSLFDKLVFEIHCDEFGSDFERLWLLSRESFMMNGLDIYAEKYGKKQKSLTVNDKLFDDLKIARARLTESFRVYNKEKNISDEDLDEGVQRVLDRLIFIRVLEDRELEPPILKALVREFDENNQKQIFHSLVKKFRELDDVYDSNLFQPHACEHWEEYGGAIRDVINMLYGNGTLAYNFKEIPADILGGVYESYLGYIAQKKSHELLRANNKRKEQGIYYTPRYIVDYIVKNTVNEKLKEIRTVGELKKIKILDPACGSGSFLTAAFEAVRNKYEDFGSRGDLYAKRTILLENIYGVDLDPQAVEIAKLNLLIDSLDEKAKLPNLTENIRVGNSLIDDPKIAGDKAFNWNEEFPEIMKSGGFDIIIGNPPYIKEDTNRLAFNGLHGSPYYQGKMDIWTLFACRAIDLLKDGGYFSFIAPSSWTGSAGASLFRSKILGNGEIIKFVDFNDFKVFKDASIQTMIFVFQKKKPRKSYRLRYAKITNKDTSSDEVANLLASGLNHQTENSNVVDATIRPADIGSKSISFSNNAVAEVLNKIAKTGNFKLSKGDIGNGIDVLQDFITDKHLAKLKDVTIKKGNGVFVLKNSVVAEMEFNNKELEYLKPYFTTSQINRYFSDKKSEYKIIYADKYFREHINEFPNLKNHIDRFKKILTSAFAPYGLHRSREERFFKGQAILLLRKTMYPAFTYIDFPCYVTRAFLILKPEKINLKYLTALLNSKPIYFWLKNEGKKQGEQLQIDKEPLLEIPLMKTTPEKEKPTVELVDKIMALTGELHNTTLDTDKYNDLKSQIAGVDHQIDQKVYELYGLSGKDIKIIEESAK